MRRAGARSPEEANGRSKNQQAYLSVRDLILGLELTPGSRVREDELQARLRVGRTPVREALQRLAHEGLLQIFPRRLIVVAKFGIEDLRQVYEARSALEPAAASLAARHFAHATDEDADALEGERLVDHRLVDVADFLARNLVFHRFVARLSNNVLLQADIEHILTLNHWLWNLSYKSRGIRQVYPLDHDPIIDAIQRGDAPAAEAAMRRDVWTSCEELVPGLPSRRSPRIPTRERVKRDPAH
jgi:GntR family transcriptional regulator, rspAB operon transcriptional repressor